MNAFLPKPFTEELLLTTIISVIDDYFMVKELGKKIEEKNGSAVTTKISLQNLYHLSGEDEQFVRQMLVSYSDSSEKGLKDMKEALISGQLGKVSELAHKLLPPSRHIGASDMCNLLKNIEEGIKNKVEIKLIETLITELIGEFKIISRLIKDHIARIG
jgi:HPt (histidine-containing phosphotransfer) domain-containing protein